MIKIEKTSVYGFEEAIRGMRNPMNSWEKSDSIFYTNNDFRVGDADYALMMKLAMSGPVHAKYRRMIIVYVDITAPLYWWKEFDTYKVGTVINSCSTMHKIQAKKFTLEDFSHEHLMGVTTLDDEEELVPYGLPILNTTIECLNYYRDRYNETNNKKYWWQMIQLLPSSYNQKRTVMMNYEVLLNIYQHRHDHKLDEWRELCKWIETLPYSEVITYKHY